MLYTTWGGVAAGYFSNTSTDTGINIEVTRIGFWSSTSYFISQLLFCFSIRAYNDIVCYNGIRTNIKKLCKCFQ